jgi:hypothetical protein
MTYDPTTLSTQSDHQGTVFMRGIPNYIPATPAFPPWPGSIWDARHVLQGVLVVTHR